MYKHTKWVSEWLLFSDANSAILLAISWREQVNVQWDDDEDRLVQDQHAEFDLYSASSLKPQSAGRLSRLDKSPVSDLIKASS
jgi:hypothetical protein